MSETTTKQDIKQRVDGILSQMTVEEKIDYIGGDKEFYIRAMPRLGLPEIKMSDGPMGVRNYGLSTAYPANVCLAATWNPVLAGQFGAAIGRDCRARGVHILLAPGVNIYRSPLCGRNFEYMGEDPCLTATMVVPIVRAVQEQGVLATVKHFAANGQEYDRHHVSSEIDERTLREIYLQAFRAAVTKGKVACAMNAYNLLNGIHCTEHDWLNNQLLKKEWGFDGILMSDWMSTYDAVGAANGGLDLEMPFAKWMNQANLLPALADGRVSQKTIDEKVRRILRTIVRFGFLDREQTDSSIPMYDPTSAAAALAVAREGIVLLKNEKGGREPFSSLLPLDRKKLKKIAVIGPNAVPAVTGGGGSSEVKPVRAPSVLDAVISAAGEDVAVYYERGMMAEAMNPIFANSIFTCKAADGSAQQGLAAEYFTSKDLSSQPKTRRVDRTVNFDWGSQRPDWLPNEGFSIRWTGQLTPTASGGYTLVSRCDDGVRVWFGGKLVIDDWSQHPARLMTAQVQLEAGRSYDVKVEYFDAGGQCVAQFGWGTVSESPDFAAARLAKEVDAVILCVGYDAKTEGEGADRKFELPAGQERLISAVLEANPNTVVVLNAGGAVKTEGWIDRVPALLHAFFPGQEGSQAIAEILFGELNPSGKLPFTFEKRAEANPTFANYGSADMKTTYKEGIFVGYRGFDKQNIEPLFPFGHGLSYTSFVYSALKVEPAQAGAKQRVKVSFDIENTGSRAGAEVAQVYVGRVGSSVVERAPKELKGFRKVALGKGRKKTVTVTLDVADLAYWDVNQKAWVVEPGTYEVSVGASSRDIRVKGQLAVVA